MRNVVLVVVLAACGGGGKDSTDGELGGHCYPNGTCNATLGCSAGVCVPLADLPDAPIDVAIIDAPLGDTPVDTPVLPDAFVCTMQFEPNDTIGNAHPLSGTSTTLSDLALCPAGDKDTFIVSIAVANSNLEALTTYAAGAPVSISILNAGGASINNGTANGVNALRAFVANLPVGTYYVQVYGSVISTFNLTVNIQ